MARRNISLPEGLDEAARAQGLNVSALAQQAIVDALDRGVRMARLDAWLDELDAEHGPPSAAAVARAEAWLASAVPAVAGPRAFVPSGQAREEISKRAGTAAAGRKKRIAGKGVPTVVRDTKSGAVASNRTARRTPKSTGTKAGRSATTGRTRGAKS